MNKDFDTIEQAVRMIDQAMKNGKFTRVELEGIKMLAQSIIGSTDKTLARAALVNKEND